MSGPENERLVWGGMIDGDEQSLGQLMYIHYKALVHYGLKFVKSDDFIKDCIQDMFIDIWHSRQRLVTPDNIKAYLFMALKRKIVRNKSRELPLDELEEADTAEMEFSPEWWMIEEEALSIRTRRMSELLNALPPRQREVIYLKYYENLSRDEISAMLAIAPQTVSNLLQTAYSYLRRHWKFSTIGLLWSLFF